MPIKASAEREPIGTPSDLAESGFWMSLLARLLRRSAVNRGDPCPRAGDPPDAHTPGLGKQSGSTRRGDGSGSRYRPVGPIEVASPRTPPTPRSSAPT